MLVIAVGKAVLDCHVSTDDKAGLSQPLLNGLNPCGFGTLRLTMEHADHRHRCLLRARRRRPRRRAAEQRDEIAPFQLIEFPRFNISGSLAMFDATRLASSIVICFASMASASVERPETYATAKPFGSRTTLPPENLSARRGGGRWRVIRSPRRRARAALAAR